MSHQSSPLLLFLRCIFTLAFFFPYAAPLDYGNPKCQAIGCERSRVDYWKQKGFCYLCPKGQSAHEASGTIASLAWKNKLTPITVLHISGDPLSKTFNQYDQGKFYYKKQSYAYGLPAKLKNDRCMRHKSKDRPEYISLQFVLVYLHRFVPRVFKKQDVQIRQKTSLLVDKMFGPSPDHTLSVEWNSNEPAILQHRKKHGKPTTAPTTTAETQYAFIEWSRDVAVKDFEAAGDAVAAVLGLPPETLGADAVAGLFSLHATDRDDRLPDREWQRRVSQSVSLHVACDYGGSRRLDPRAANITDIRVILAELEGLYKQRYQNNPDLLSKVWTDALTNAITKTKTYLGKHIITSEELKNQEKTKKLEGVTEKCSKQAHAFVGSLLGPAATPEVTPQTSPVDTRRADIDRLLGLAAGVPQQQQQEQLTALQPLPQLGQLPAGF